MKRPFRREQGLLRDEYSDPRGRVTAGALPASSFGEALGESDRLLNLKAVSARDPGGQYLGVTALEADGASSAAMVERLLQLLDADSPVAATALLRFASDGRVRPAILRSAGRVAAEDLANFAHALSKLGGEESRAVLSARARELLEDPTTFRSEPDYNRRAGSLAALAAGLLSLNVDQEIALTALEKLLSHPCRRNRNAAAETIAGAIAHGVPPAMRERLTGQFLQLINSNDHELFAAVGPVAAEKRLEDVLRRSQELLESDDPAERDSAARVLQAIEDPRAAALLNRQLEHEEWTPLACDIALHLGVAAKEASRAAIAERALADEAPLIRLKGVQLLASLRSQAARDAATHALADEPDSALRARLEVLAAG